MKKGLSIWGCQSFQKLIHLSQFIPPEASSKKVLKSQLFVDKYSENIQHTFLDYVAGGYELNFMVAIDSLTGGNGKFRQVL
ncbi:hypothetical protein ACS0TY_024077 [Phlomoides rotata]